MAVLAVPMDKTFEVAVDKVENFDKKQKSIPENIFFRIGWKSTAKVMLSGIWRSKKFKYKFKRISSINIELIEEFSCGLEELDKKLIQMKENDEWTTFVFLDETNGQIIGYCTYCASGLKKLMKMIQ